MREARPSSGLVGKQLVLGCSETIKPVIGEGVRAH